MITISGMVGSGGIRVAGISWLATVSNAGAVGHSGIDHWLTPVPRVLLAISTTPKCPSAYRANARRSTVSASWTALTAASVH